MSNKVVNIKKNVLTDVEKLNIKVVGRYAVCVTPVKVYFGYTNLFEQERAGALSSHLRNKLESHKVSVMRLKEENYV